MLFTKKNQIELQNLRLEAKDPRYIDICCVAKIGMHFFFLLDFVNLYSFLEVLQIDNKLK